MQIFKMIQSIPEARHGFLYDGFVAALVKDKRQGRDGRPPNQGKQVVIKHACRHVQELAFAGRASS